MIFIILNGILYFFCLLLLWNEFNTCCKFFLLCQMQKYDGKNILKKKIFKKTLLFTQYSTLSFTLHIFLDM